MLTRFAPTPSGYLHRGNAANALLASWLAEQKQPVWRAKAIRQWLFARRAASFADMTDLPKGLRAALEGAVQIWTTTIARHHQADDGTRGDGQRHALEHDFALARIAQAQR